MGCVNPDGTLSSQAESILKALVSPKELEEVARETGLPLYRVRSAVRELSGADLVEEDRRHLSGHLGRARARRMKAFSPRFQVQMGRVALLRDMINWCVEQPVRGTRFEPDDERMRALEAYIYAQRRGKSLEYGKH